jgi:putative DNA primase/helicase
VPDADRLAQARRIFDNTVPASGSLVERYLRSRGITIPVPDCLRYHPALWCSETKYNLPGMVAPRSGIDGTLVAIHRTFLKYDGTGKAALTMPRKDLGNWKGGAIRLSPVADELMIGEGIETTLAAIEMYGLPGWASGSAIAMRQLVLPDDVRSVIVLADGDDPGEAAARFSAQRWLRQGRKVRIARAPRGKDFNDVLIEGAAS